MLRPLARMFDEGKLSTEIEARYPLQQARDAVAHALREGRRGKVLLTMEPV
jgi:NADPH:quinone reductase-like Zn-dependent oxidoreductase